MHQRQRQEIQSWGGVQSAVQHDGGAFKFENIARQRRVSRQAILEFQKEKATISQDNVQVYRRTGSLLSLGPLKVFFFLSPVMSLARSLGIKWNEQGFCEAALWQMSIFIYINQMQLKEEEEADVLGNELKSGTRGVK